MGFFRSTAATLFLLAAALPEVRGQAATLLQLEVTDPAGAPVNAEGVLEPLPTGQRRRFVVPVSGTFSLRDVSPGEYRLSLSRPGFAPFTEQLRLEPGQSLRRPVVLRIAAPAFAVMVVASPAGPPDRAVLEMPAPVQIVRETALQTSGALDLSDFLNRRANGVFLNELQGNPLQPDVNFRGFTASPLLGTPQGLSAYLDGMRLNQPFGDVVSWDLLPKVAIEEVALQPGANPLFGLNTLGGALVVTTKSGLSHPGTALQLRGGSFGRLMADVEHGGATVRGWHWFLGGSLFFEDGWRESSPSNVRQAFAKLGRRMDRGGVSLSLGYANNSLIGNGLQEFSFLDRDRRSVYTKPDRTANQSPYVGLNFQRQVGAPWSLSGTAYYRQIRTATLNGDINEESLDQALYQPTFAEQRALREAGYTGVPLAGEDASNTPFPFWRCIANGLLNEEPTEKCNGLLNRGAIRQHSYGFALQSSWTTRLFGSENRLTAGGGYDGSRTGFQQSTEFGYLNPDRTVTGIAAFADGVSGGFDDGEPVDNRVDLSSRVHSYGMFLADSISPHRRVTATLSARFHQTVIDNYDRILPTAGGGSLTGKHTFRRLNPAAGLTYQAAEQLNLYAGWSESSRAPTAIELGCADPAFPCRLPNAMAGDPPLSQVITRSVEAGARGAAGNGLSWSAGYFRSANRDDILFVAAPQTGFGYFRNFGRTLRQGAEFSVSGRIRKVNYGANYTLLAATFQTAEEVNGSGNSTNEEALEGAPGLEGAIRIKPGNRIPLIPAHMAKVWADFQATARFSIHAGVVGASGSYARGNENNAHSPDGTYYLGEGRSPGYAVVNLGARYRLSRRVELFGQVNNLLNQDFRTAAQLGPMGFTAQGQFIARPLPPAHGEYPVRQSTFYAPGAPFGAWGGLRIQF